MTLQFNRSTLEYLASYFQSLCANQSSPTTDFNAVASADVTSVGDDVSAANTTRDDAAADAEAAFNAFLFIAVVLSFYSAGVVVMLVMYMREEKKDYEEDKLVHGYFKMMTQKKTQHVIITAVIKPASLITHINDIATVRASPHDDRSRIAGVPV